MDHLLKVAKWDLIAKLIGLVYLVPQIPYQHLKMELQIFVSIEFAEWFLIQLQLLPVYFFLILTSFFINISKMITFLISRIFFAGTASMIVSSFTKPFILQVHTDNTEGSAAPQPAESNNRGFCFNFIQKPCIV